MAELGRNVLWAVGFVIGFLVGFTKTRKIFENWRKNRERNSKEETRTE